MYSIQFLPMVIKHFKFSRLIRSVPFEFDAKSGKLVPMKSRRRTRVTQMQSIIALSYFLVLVHHFCTGDMSMVKRLQGITFLDCYMVLIFGGWNVGLDIAPIQLINSILSFEQNLLRGMYRPVLFLGFSITDSFSVNYVFTVSSKQ